MNLDEFKSTIENGDSPPDGLGDPLKALWYEAKGDWERAHDLSQSAGNRDGDWVHAYLHRVEGDLSNASYWYSRAGRPRFDGSLAEEWDAIVGEMLAG